MSAELIPELHSSRFHPSLPQPASRDCPVQKRPPACPPTTFAGPLGGQMFWHRLQAVDEQRK